MGTDFRVAVVGRRRLRSGTGPFVAEYLARRGAQVHGWDRAEAGRLLDPASRHPEIDAVAICSPAETHLGYLEAAVLKGLHVFCEKPIAWPENHSPEAFQEIAGRVGRLLEAAGRSGLVVHENTQWVYTVEEFRRMAGAAAEEPVERFRCELSPSSGVPVEMMMECSAHANSLLLEFGRGEVENPRVRFQTAADGRGRLEIDFDSRGASGGPVRVEYRFMQQSGQPRHAAYEVNQARAERRIELNGYRIFFRVGEWEREIRDPLHLSVEHFLAKVAGAVPNTAHARIIENLRMSGALVEACSRQCEAHHA
jgi:hypothetical protein